MKQMSNTKKFLISLTVPVLILLALTIKPFLTILTGETIYLRTEPKDPRDLFYGDYVTLDFEIENLPLELIDSGLKEKLDLQTDYFDLDDKVVYILLERQESTGAHEAKQVSLNKPSKDQTFIKTELRPYVSTKDRSDEDSSKMISLSIPLENYYIEEGTGLDLEKASITGDIKVKAKVRDGYPIMVGLEIVN